MDRAIGILESGIATSTALKGRSTDLSGLMPSLSALASAILSTTDSRMHWFSRGTPAMGQVEVVRDARVTTAQFMRDFAAAISRELVASCPTFVSPARGAGLAAGEAASATTTNFSVGFVVGALGVLLVTSMLKGKRKNPVISNGTRRFYAQPDAAVKYLEEGFSVVGKTSSGRRRRRAKK